MARKNTTRDRRQPAVSTRRQVLRRFLGAAGVVPALSMLPATALAQAEDAESVQGLVGGYQQSPPEQAGYPAPSNLEWWQQPNRPEPLIPDDAVVLPILMYHRATLATVFESQLVGMLTAGYTPLSLHSALKGLLGEEELPDMPIVLTFDDGWEIQYDAVFPVLKQYKVPATFFVMPGFHELQEGYMNWDQLTEIADFGMEVESHTLNHADLPLLARHDWGAVLAEVVISKQILEERLGRALRYFDYPFGRQDEEIQQVVEAAGYDAAVIIGPGVHQSAATPYALRRIRVEAWDPWTRVEHKLAWYGAGPDDFSREEPETAQAETATDEAEKSTSQERATE